MYIRSTGLGRTLLTCHVHKIEITNVVPSTLKDPEKGKKEPKRMLMTIQTTDPVAWTVRGFVEPADLRGIILAALKPSVIFTAIRFLLFGGGSKKAKETVAESPAAVPQQGSAAS